MALFETWLRSDLKKPLQVVPLEGKMFSSDNEGNRVGVEVMDNGSQASLSGGVTGYIIRADGATVTVTGTLSGNKASIVLPSSAYVVPGQISIVIKIGTTTVGACSGVVYRTTTDTLVDPGHVIPSITELLAKIADCEAATAAAMKVANMTVSAEAASGSTPTATLSEVGSGSSAHKHITFGLIPGQDGADGQDGQDGQDGADGVNAYVYVRWSANQPTQDSDMSTTPNDWMGVYGGSAASAPTHYTDYQWYKVKGETGTAENIYGSTVPMSPQDSTKVETAINGKLTKPATAGTSGQVLTSDGQGGQSWQTPSGGTVTDVQEDGVSILSSGVANILTMTGAGASAAGTKGLVPAPSAGEHTYYLRGDGDWAEPPSGKLYVVDLDTVTNTSGSYTHSTTLSDVTADMKAVAIELGDPSVFLDTITITTADGSVTLSCDSVEGTSTVKVSLMFVASADALTSSEFDVLAGRIGSLSSLTTTDKTSLVAATNEINDAIATLTGKFSTIEDKKVTRVGTYFTERDAFKARRVGNTIVIFSYVNISTQVPSGTNFADTGFSSAEGMYTFMEANGSKATMVTCSGGKLKPTDSTLATGYYYVSGCAVTPV